MEDTLDSDEEVEYMVADGADPCPCRISISARNVSVQTRALNSPVDNISAPD